MDVIERSKFVDEEDRISLTNRLKAMLDYKGDWYGRMQAQITVTQRLGRSFKSQHVLLRNISIPGIDEGEPYMILISPQGIRILMAFPVIGVFRANETEWLKLDQRSNSFTQAKPNLLMLALNIQKQVSRLLEVQNIRAPMAESVLFFTHPGTLIDGSRPACRIVSADAIEYFAANLEQLPSVLNTKQIHTLVDAIISPQYPDPQFAGSLITDPKLKRPPIQQVHPIPKSRPFPNTYTTQQEDSFFELPQDDVIESIDRFLPDEELFQELTPLDDTAQGKTHRSKQTGKSRMSKGQLSIIGILVIIQIVLILIFAFLVLKDMRII